MENQKSLNCLNERLGCPYFQMRYVSAYKTGSSVPSVLFRIDIRYRDEFLKNIRHLTSINLHHCKESVKKRAVFYSDLNTNNEKVLFGYNMFGFNAGFAYCDERYLYINVSLHCVGISDVSLTLSVIFKTIEKTMYCKELVAKMPQSCLQLFNVNTILRDAGKGKVMLGVVFPTYYLKEKLQNKKLRNFMEYTIFKVMEDARRSIIVLEKESKQFVSKCKVNIDFQDNFSLFCPEYPVQNIMLGVAENDKVTRLNFNVTDDVQNIVLFAGLVALGSIVVKYS